ncbi:myo-inositol 2-dehydrogenase [Plasmopara halstedii]|uniref:Myo-inositol 2-dehydrogenase n=1 Tax=Plasmopara halstedii TaxID=4781 RepID=A0A0P1AH83_PLAHL|nr:myo-inositol 2-dehydrogenase [Plasmopara halstedii]CEG40166.1 myo-inositol 2-dehydrogenase [Plasmopara halstedii]|eukprot:XP_024576535.1 myo-inositol 2-dehydrogenase [Plasmopara halstedii]
MSGLSSPKPLRVGILGAGRIAKVHVQSLQRIGADIVIIADPIGNVAETVAANFRIASWTKNVSEVFQADIDAVVICSPTALHAEQIIEAAHYKKHIFCEKPLDLNLEVVDKAIKAVSDAGVKLVIGFNRRYDSNFLRIKKAINCEEIGKVNMLRITSRDPELPPIEYIKGSGGIFCDMTIHDFDMARFLIGGEVDEVFAMGHSNNPEVAAVGDIDTAVILLKFCNGVICNIENSREAVFGYDQRVEALGSKGSVLCDNNYENQVVLSTKENVHRDLPQRFIVERYMDAYVAEMEAFARVCTTDAPSPVGGEAARDALLLALAASKSLAENRPVKVDEIRKST